MNLEFLKSIPAQSYDEAQNLGDQMVAGGPETVRQLVEMVGDQFGDPQGVKAKYAIHGLAVYAARPGADQDRKMVAGALAAELDGDHSDELKAFVCRQLQLCGDGQQVPSLAGLLDDARLCEPATQALVAIRGDAALAALQAALSKADGTRQITIGQAVETLTAG